MNDIEVLEAILLRTIDDKKRAALSHAITAMKVVEWLKEHHGRQYTLQFHRYVSDPKELWMIVQVSQIIYSAPTLADLAKKTGEGK